MKRTRQVMLTIAVATLCVSSSYLAAHALTARYVFFCQLAGGPTLGYQFASDAGLNDLAGTLFVPLDILIDCRLNAIHLRGQYCQPEVQLFGYRFVAVRNDRVICVIYGAHGLGLVSALAWIICRMCRARHAGRSRQKAGACAAFPVAMRSVENNER